MAKPKPSPFRFRKLDSVGSADAEEDSSFLGECFVDNGDLEALRDTDCPRRIVIGRTGSGKSALLLRLAAVEDRVIQVRPESLALAYISNSTILQFLSKLGVKLDIFFRLLWRHVFTVEILKHHFHIKSESDRRTFIQRILDLFQDKKHTNALKYLQEWGQSFWEETEYRIKELTTKLESDLKSSISVPSAIPIECSVEAIKSMSEEQKHDVVQRAQRVVNAVQIRQLSEILDLLHDVLSDEQKRYYIVLDRLDENWIEEELRFRLIRALIETIKDFSRVKSVKIIAAVRLDLLERVFRLTRDAGFQEEKYESLYLPLEWSRSQLESLLDLRINHLIKARYCSATVSHRDILPKQVDGETALQYMLDRTLMRPRDLILFFNACISKSLDRPAITAQNIRESEAEYSHLRLRSLGDEWVSDYAHLVDFAFVVRSAKPEIAVADIDSQRCEDIAFEVVARSASMAHRDELIIAAERLVNAEITMDAFKQSWVQVYYRVGMIGLKLLRGDGFVWSSASRRTVAASEIAASSLLRVHPMFWRALCIEARR